MTLRAEPPRHGQRRAARATSDVEHPMPGSGANHVDEQVFKGLEHQVEQPLRRHPGVSGAAVPKRRLLVFGLVVDVHGHSPLLAPRGAEAKLCKFKST